LVKTGRHFLADTTCPHSALYRNVWYCRYLFNDALSRKLV